MDVTASQIVRNRLIAKIREFHKTTGKPANLHLTWDLELHLYTLDVNEVGPDFVNAMVRYGVRGAVEKQGGLLYGLKVHWDATEDKVS